MSDYMPGFEHQLLEAAHRRRRSFLWGWPRRLKPTRTGPLALAGAVLLAGAATAAVIATGQVGGKPTMPTPRVPSEEAHGITRQTEPVVIGTGRLPRSGERFELVGYRYRSAGRSLLCIDLALLSSGTKSGCGDEQVYGGGDIEITGKAGSFRSSLTQLTGTTSARVASVLVHYRNDGQHHTRPATHVGIDAPALLKRIQVDKPFGYYVAEIPQDATKPMVEALDRKGHTIDRTRAPLAD